VTYRDPLEAARARIAALEDLLDAQEVFAPTNGTARADERQHLRELRGQLAEERAEHAARAAEAADTERRLAERIAFLEGELREEKARRQVEVSLLRSKLEEAERQVKENASLFEAEQTMRRAEVEGKLARLRRDMTVKDVTLRELREEVRVHLGGSLAEVRAWYAEKVRQLGTELAESGTLSRHLEESLVQAERAVASLPPADARDREGLVERELAKRKLAIGKAELGRVRARIERLEHELSRITDAEAKLAIR
jgi:hypothetical protein